MNMLNRIKLFCLLGLSTFFLNVNASDSRTSEFDVLNYSIRLNIVNLGSKSINGNAVLKVKLIKSSVKLIVLDLAKLGVDSILIQGIKQSFTKNDSQLFISVSQDFNTGDTVDLNCFYGGVPIQDSKWGGFYFSGKYAFNMGVGFTVNPHNFGRAWFPCVDNFEERSTYDFHITTDSGYMAVCNGIPQASNVHNDQTITWNWVLSNPIPTYLACVAVSTYTPVKYVYQGKEKAYEIILAAQAQDTAKVKLSMVNLTKALQFFEDKFAPYPFERAGYVMVPFNGGAMEHATCITYPLFGVDGTLTYETLMAHELSHMWWGDMVTCESASEMWLNEGWASFCEAMFLELMYDKNTYYTDMNEKLLEVMRFAHVADKSFLVLNQIPHEVTYGTHVYKKGALTVAALRYYMGDTAFFKACNSYLTKYKFQTSSSLKLRDEFQKFTSVNLTQFFNDWVFTAGSAAVVLSSYKVMVGNAANFVELNVKQYSRGNNISYSYIPFKITLFDTLGNKYVEQDSLNGSEKQIMVRVPYTFMPAFVLINENNELPLAKTYSLQTIKGTGIKADVNALLTLNVQQNTDSATILAEHYWVGAKQNEVTPKGVRISQYRFWNIDGNFDANKFKAQVYFNFDGTTPASTSGGWLDYTLPFTNEDSLVLLFKPQGSNEWILHTDNTRISGGSKLDKTGRFTANKIEKGMYAIGMYDFKSGVKNIQEKESDFLLYPNPTKHQINIEINEKLLNSDAVIYDINGKQFAKVQLTKTTQTINIDNLAKGVYYLKIENNNSQQAKMFVVE